mmetsp:Transcript_24621/g.46831  ORF Transcript_24621/g.46831 Transcript_24621/m.46831 type:complete len:352 (-) Transcript_24621:815-1870(-)
MQNHGQVKPDRGHRHACHMLVDQGHGFLTTRQGRVQIIVEKVNVTNIEQSAGNLASKSTGLACRFVVVFCHRCGQGFFVLLVCHGRRGLGNLVNDCQSFVSALERLLQHTHGFFGFSQEQVDLRHVSNRCQVDRVKLQGRNLVRNRSSKMEELQSHVGSAPMVMNQSHIEESRLGAFSNRYGKGAFVEREDVFSWNRVLGARQINGECIAKYQGWQGTGCTDTLQFGDGKIKHARDADDGSQPRTSFCGYGVLGVPHQGLDLVHQLLRFRFSCICLIQELLQQFRHLFVSFITRFLGRRRFAVVFAAHDGLHRFLKELHGGDRISLEEHGVPQIGRYSRMTQVFVAGRHAC